MNQFASDSNRLGGGSSPAICSAVSRELREPSAEGPRSTRRRGLGRSENGQAAVEFALVVPLVCILILFFVDFAKAMNFWLDANRVANEGARLAAVNADGLTPDLIKNRFIFGAERDSATVAICYASAGVGEPVTVQVTIPHNWILIPDWIPGGAGGGGTWNITSRATMRQELKATYASSGACA
jgi:hypothetical protein